MSTRTHFKQLLNPDYLGAYALSDGNDKILTIKGVTMERITGTGGKKEDCPVCRFVENEKPMILNVTNCKTIAKLYSTPIIEDWAGKRIQVFADTTRFGGEMVECLRIRPFIPAMDTVPPCESCGKPISAYGTMSAKQVADHTLRKYGRALCGECAKAVADAAKAEAAKQDALGEVEA